MAHNSTDRHPNLPGATHPGEAQDDEAAPAAISLLPMGVKIGFAMVLAIIWVAIFAKPALGNLPWK